MAASLETHESGTVLCHPSFSKGSVRSIEIHQRMKIQSDDACLSLKQMYWQNRKLWDREWWLLGKDCYRRGILGPLPSLSQSERQWMERFSGQKKSCNMRCKSVCSLDRNIFFFLIQKSMHFVSTGWLASNWTDCVEKWCSYNVTILSQIMGKKWRFSFGSPSFLWEG